MVDVILPVPMYKSLSMREKGGGRRARKRIKINEKQVAGEWAMRMFMNLCVATFCRSFQHHYHGERSEGKNSEPRARRGILDVDISSISRLI